MRRLRIVLELTIRVISDSEEAFISSFVVDIVSLNLFRDIRGQQYVG